MGRMLRAERFAVLLALTSLWCGTVRVAAEEAVFVSFEFADPLLVARLGTGRAALEQDVVTWLVTTFDKTYP